MKNQLVITNDNEIIFGKHKFKVENFDLYYSLFGSERYDLKIKHYPGGFVKKTYCNYRTFRVPFPRPKERLNRKVEYELTGWELEKYRREKEKESTRRSINAIQDLMYLNPQLEYFITLTFDITQVDSSSPEAVYNKLKHFLKNAVQRQGLQYILIPEYHKKGNKLHFHGAINNAFTLKPSGTYLVEGFKKPMRMAKIKRKGLLDQIKKEVFNIPDWSCGFSTAIELDEQRERAVGYVLKYLTKELENMEKYGCFPERPFGRRYFSSKNIEKYPLIELCNYKGSYENINLPEYDNPYNDYRYKYESNLGRTKIE